MVFLIAVVSFLANNLTAFLIVVILVEGHVLIASTEAIIIPSLFYYNFSSLYFKSDAWIMETRE